MAARLNPSSAPVEIPKTEPERLTFAMSPDSLGAAKIAIDRAFQDAERYRESRGLLAELVTLKTQFAATVKRLEEVLS